jgi:hypothetical protein
MDIVAWLRHQHWYDWFGYLGSILMFSTFYMKTMIPLRLVGIAANVCMIIFTLLAHVTPVLVLQACLLPLNVYRLVQMKRMIEKVKDASQGDFRFDALIPFMTLEKHAKGTVLFRAGDPSKKMYLIQTGEVRLQELGKVIGKGEVLGEIGILSPSNRRTGTAICATDVDFMTITEDKVLQLYYQDPKFGLFLVRLVIQRLLRNIDPRATMSPPEPATETR